MRELMNEANRCLLCKNSMCRKGCPINTDIPKVVSLYKEGKMGEAGKVLFDNNPLSSICAIVCPHEKQCAGNCIRGIKGEPISFYKIEQEISTEFLKNAELNPVKRDSKKVAVVASKKVASAIDKYLSQDN